MVKKKKQELANKGVAKSAVSNGKDLLKGVDGRSSLARRYRDVMEALIADQGGPAALSEVRRQLIRRFSACAVLAEDLSPSLSMARKSALPITPSFHPRLCE